MSTNDWLSSVVFGKSWLLYLSLSVGSRLLLCARWLWPLVTACSVRCVNRLVPPPTLARRSLTPLFHRCQKNQYQYEAFDKNNYLNYFEFDRIWTGCCSGGHSSPGIQQPVPKNRFRYAAFDAYNYLYLWPVVPPEDTPALVFNNRCLNLDRLLLRRTLWSRYSTTGAEKPVPVFGPVVALVLVSSHWCRYPFDKYNRLIK